MKLWGVLTSHNTFACAHKGRSHQTHHHLLHTSCIFTYLTSLLTILNSLKYPSWPCLHDELLFNCQESRGRHFTFWNFPWLLNSHHSQFNCVCVCVCVCVLLHTCSHLLTCVWAFKKIIHCLFHLVIPLLTHKRHVIIVYWIEYGRNKFSKILWMSIYENND